MYRRAGSEAPGDRQQAGPKGGGWGGRPRGRAGCGARQPATTRGRRLELLRLRCCCGGGYCCQP
eukprot:4117657-Lingulodinium_polyedra.AAC.1